MLREYSILSLVCDVNVNIFEHLQLHPQTLQQWFKSLPVWTQGACHLYRGRGFVKEALLNIATFKARAKAPCPSHNAIQFANINRSPQSSEPHLYKCNCNGSVYVLYKAEPES